MRCRPPHRAALGALPFARCSLSAYLRTGQCTSQAAHTTSAPGLPVERIATVPTPCSQQRGVRHAACEACVAASACTVYDSKRRRGLHGKRPPAWSSTPSAKGRVVSHSVLTTHTTQPLFIMPRLTQADREGAWVESSPAMAYEERLADGNVVACGRIGTGHKVRRASRRLFQPPREDFHDNDCTVHLGSTTVACRAPVFPLEVPTSASCLPHVMLYVVPCRLRAAARGLSPH